MKKELGHEAIYDARQLGTPSAILSQISLSGRGTFVLQLAFAIIS